MTYDVVIIGGGAAGLAAVEGAKAGGAKQVALVERAALGGECPNEACVPTKSMLASVRLFHTVAAEGARHGVVARGLRFDWAAAVRRKDAVVQAITGGGKKYTGMLKALGVEHVSGTARLIDKNTVQVGKRLIATKSVVIATGATERLPDIAGIHDISWLTYRDVLTLKKLPRSAIILGGGAVAVELATLLGSAGVPVTVIESAKHLLPREDEEIATLLQAELQRLGVAVHVGALPLGIKKEKKGVACTWQKGILPRRTTVADVCILATGRQSNLSELDLEAAGVALDHHDQPAKVSTKLALTKNIFLAGDANAQPQFTATAHYAGWIAGWNAATVGKARQQRAVDWSIVPRVIFSTPEYASVGLSAQQAAKDFSIEIKRAPFALLSRAATDGAATGLAKIIVEKKSGRLLGAHVFGPHAGEIIHEVALAMRHGLTWSELTSGLRAFPTYSEILAFAE